MEDAGWGGVAYIQQQVEKFAVITTLMHETKSRLIDSFQRNECT
jgi:hypothetical protein